MDPDNTNKTLCTIKICSSTQSPEKFICINPECYQMNKLQCYECLNKQHREKNKTIQHIDDFIEIDKVMKKIQEKNNKKEQFINQLILMCNDFQKEKIQQIELTQKQDVAILAREKIEQDISQFTIILGQEIMKFKSYLFYSHNKHEQLIKQYQENEQIYIENIKFQYKQIVEKIQTFVFSLDYDIKSQLIKLEDKIKCITIKNKGISYSNVILFIIPFILSYFINQHNFDTQQQGIFFQLNTKFEEHISDLKDIKKSIEELLIQKIENHQRISFQSFEKIENKFTEFEESQQKLKLRFDTFKKSQSAYNLDFKTQISAYGEEINRLFNSVETLKQNNEDFFQKIEKQQVQILSASNEISMIKKIFNEKSQETKLPEIQDGLLQKFIQKNILKAMNQDLLGKINRNIPLSRFQYFSLIFDHYLTQNIALSTMDKLFKLATKENEDPLICLGGLATSNLSEFLVVACDYASEVFQPTNDTTQARKSPNGDIYWYLVDYFSFGFSPSEKIYLALCDVEEPESELRFSYWFSTRLRQGGRRIGKFTNLSNSIEHKMRIYMLR